MNGGFIDIEVLTFVDLLVIFWDLLVNFWTYLGNIEDLGTRGIIKKITILPHPIQSRPKGVPSRSLGPEDPLDFLSQHISMNTHMPFPTVTKSL